MKQYPFYSTIYYNTFKDFVDDIKKYGDNPAVAYFGRKGNEIVRTYREMCSDVEAVRKALKAKGLMKKRAVLVGENSYEWLITFLAVTSGGGVVIALNTDLDDESFERAVKYADGDYVFTSSACADAFENVFKENKENIILLDSEEACDGYENVQSLISMGNMSRGEKFEAIDPSDDCLLMYTSGTSSDPKAVRISHANILNDCSGSVAVIDLGMDIFSGLPFFHAYGLNCGALHSFMVGAKLTICGEKRNIIKDAFQSGASTFFAVPLMLDVIYKRALKIVEDSGQMPLFNKIIKNHGKVRGFAKKKKLQEIENLRQSCFGNLKRIVVGGAYTNDEVINNIECLGMRVFQGYGITECSPLVSVNRNDFYESNTVGTVLPGFEIKFVNGEIRLKGPSVTKGYYKNPEATSEAFDEDGWFKTGDNGYMTHDGNLVVSGRCKNLIVFKNGNKVSPENIERLLLKTQLISEAVVYTVPFGNDEDDVGIAAAIYPNMEQLNGLGQVEIFAKIQRYVDEINANMPNYQQIKFINLRDKPFARTATGKIKLTEN